MGGELVHLDQSKAFDRVDHLYLGSVLETAGLDPGLRGWLSVIHGSIFHDATYGMAIVLI